MERQLHSSLFSDICTKWGTPEIDLFASRLNHQVDTYKYMCLKPDSGAIEVNAMAAKWSHWFFYAFPLFNTIGRVLQKNETANAIGMIIVVPYWPTHLGFAKFTNMCIDISVMLYSREVKHLLRRPWRPQHQLLSTQSLVALTCKDPSTAEMVFWDFTTYLDILEARHTSQCS